MGGITVQDVENYIYTLLPPRDEVLAEMEAEAAKNNIPIIGPAVARVIYQLAIISGAKKVFEMGSAIGYSTIWLARAVGDGGRVIYTDGDKKTPTKPGDISNAPESAIASASHRRRARIALRRERALRHHLQRRGQNRLSARLSVWLSRI